MRAIDRKPRCVPGGECRAQPLELQARLDRQASGSIAGHRKICSQRTCCHAGAPNDRPGVDALTAGQSRAASIDRGNFDPGAGLDMQCRQCLRDDRACALAHVGPDPFGVVGQNDARPRLRVICHHGG